MKLRFTLLLCLAATALAHAADGLVYDFNADGSCTLVKADCAGDVTVPATVTDAGASYTVTAIGPDAFVDSGVTSLTLPATIEHIGTNAFSRCHRLEYVSVPSLESWLSITFDNEYSSPLAGFCPLHIGDTPLTRLTLPAGTTALKPYAFFDCSSLEQADLSGLAEIGAHAFDGCESLTSVNVSAGLQNIGDWAFNICCALTGITLPPGVETIGQGAFYGCRSLASVTLPPDLQTIPPLCFAGCTSLETLDFLPQSVQTLGTYAFYFCTGLTSAHCPESVRHYGDYLFYDCESLESASLPCPEARVGEFLFANCRGLKSVSLPENMEAFPQGLFLECNALESVDIPRNVTEIDDYAFADCLALRYISFPEKLRYIGARAMYGCPTLTRLEFPASMEQIDAEAFYLCYGLKQIHVRSIEPINISFFSFDWQADREAEVYVPAVSLELYRNDSFGWANFDHLTGLEEYNPDTILGIRNGNVTVNRAVAYGAEITLDVTRPDGTRPSAVTFNGEPLDMADDGTVTIPPVTGPSTLAID